VPVTLYDPGKTTFQDVRGFRGRSPDGYTLRTASEEPDLLVDLARGAYREVQTEPAPSLAAGRPF